VRADATISWRKNVDEYSIIFTSALSYKETASRSLSLHFHSGQALSEAKRLAMIANMKSCCLFRFLSSIELPQTSFITSFDTNKRTSINSTGIQDRG
jgi:hypothetical protein